MRLLFIHGAGGYAEDRALAEALAAELGAEVVMPQLSDDDDDITVEAWSPRVREALGGLGEEDVVVAHSFGATVLLHVLATQERRRDAALLAVPDWGPDGWDVAGFVPPAGLSGGGLTLHHCRDDDVVPLEHLALAAARLPGAATVAHESGGHQFQGLAEAIAARTRTGGEPHTPTTDAKEA